MFLSCLDVSVLHVECSQPEIFCGQDQDTGVLDSSGMGVLSAAQLQFPDAADVSSRAWLHGKI